MSPEQALVYRRGNQTLGHVCLALCIQASCPHPQSLPEEKIQLLHLVHTWSVKSQMSLVTEHATAHGGA